VKLLVMGNSWSLTNLAKVVKHWDASDLNWLFSRNE
jgi:hypothetical protein